jgi:hypothetical protein
MAGAMPVGSHVPPVRRGPPRLSSGVDLPVSAGAEAHRRLHVVAVRQGLLVAGVDGHEGITAVGSEGRQHGC